ncbi:MAG TPA: adenylate kinase [Chloroflexi bacterium]|nr:adenylate kinase [Chloroflexota bacterium]
MATYVVLLGPPGAGKGTQAELISAELGIPHISTGDLFRAMKTQDTPLARRVQAIMATGALVDDATTVEVLKERLVQPDCRERGALLDGFPRTQPQAEALDRLLAEEFGAQVDVAVLLDVSEEEAVRRISGRRVCPECHRIYHVEDNPPRQPGICDDDGAELIQRPDDRPEVVKERYRLYLDKTAPLIDYYRQKGVLREVDACRPIEMITPDLVKAIRAYAAG